MLKRIPLTALKRTAAAVIALQVALTAGPVLAETPQSQSGTAVAPIREAAQSIGAKLEWNPSDRTISVTFGEHKLVFKVGSNKATLDGTEVVLNEEVHIVSGQALVSSSFMAEVFGISSSQADPADQFLAAIQAGDGDAASWYMGDTLAKSAPPAALSQLWANYEMLYGKGQQIDKKENTNAVHRNVTYSFSAANAPFEVTVRLNHDGAVDDLFIGTSVPSTYQKPEYDIPEAYIEQEIQIGQGAFALPGSLTLPIGDGPFPAMILIHGSGTHDRDSSIGGAKPFRDLAVGLASQGIAVLRYDKVTYEHTFKIAADPKLTLTRESVDDVLLAVDLLRNNPSINASQIYIAGHSQGGFAMPLMVDKEKSGDVAGHILLSAPSSKFTSALIEQQAELLKRAKELGLDPAPYEQQAGQITAIMQMVDDPKYTVDHLPEHFPFQPTYWWFEQKNYVASQLAQTQSGPLLILQGENDWQVTMNQFEGWKTALRDRSDVIFKSYPKVNHLLAEYDGVSIGAEYNQPSNVSKAIIDDIAAWIISQSK